LASIAIDSAEEGGKAPVSQHPAFPVVVALWFAALLGLGTLLVPIALLERVVDLTGLASAVSVAAPPLGITARLLIAAAGAIAGALFGWVIARRVADTHRPTAAARIAAPAGRLPLSALEDLDEEGIAAAPAPTKRRSLAMAEDQRPSDFLRVVPVPGEDISAPASAPEALPQEQVFERAEDIPERSPTPVERDEDALELSELAAEQPIATDFIPPVLEADDREQPQDFPMSDNPPAQFPSAEELERRRAERRQDAAARNPGGFERRLYLRRAADEPLPFLAPSLARRAPDNENTAPDTLAVRVNFDSPAMPALEQAFEECEPATAPEPAVDWEHAPLGELGMIDLVQRLGATLEKRREQAAVAPARDAFASPAPMALAPESHDDDFDGALDGVEAAAEEEAVQAMAAYFARPADTAEPAGEPAPCEPHAFGPAAPVPDQSDDDDDRDLAASFSLPLGQSWTRAGPADEEAAEHEAAPDYGSLLTLRNPFHEPREEFVRIEEPAPAPGDVKPTVVFSAAEVARPFDPPSAGPAAAAVPSAPPAETDEALRRALATLQRMSRGG
jgi:hypothetical protein